MPVPNQHDDPRWRGPHPEPPAGRDRTPPRRRHGRGMITLPGRRPWRWPWLLLVALLAVAALLAGGLAWVWSHTSISTVGDLAFENPLRIPPLAEPRFEEARRRVFDLEFQSGRTQILPGPPTGTWGLNGTYLSPTLRAARGDEVQINVTNRLAEPTTLHWHGMHLPAIADGGPHQMIEPGDTWSPTWTIDQPATTLWFHPHLHGSTAEHVYRGVAGMFIIDDPDAAALDLPDEYGVDDIPVIVQDRSFDGSNQLTQREPAFSNIGILGDEILINGTHDPHVEVITELVRLRVLNASNARHYNLQFDDHREFALIGTDGGVLAVPVSLTELRLSPGERAEIVVGVAPGERTVLRSVKPDLGTSSPFGDRPNGGADSFDLLQLRAADSLEPSAPLPDELVAVDAPLEADSVKTRSFELGNDEIDGRQFDMGRIDHVVTVDTAEIWEITNDHTRPHSFHPHLIHFAVLDIDGRTPPPELSGWKDTIYVPPSQTVRVIARFAGHSDPDAPYMFHCHVLEHEDAGMMGQFVVIEPGDETPGRVEHADG
jgi:blue copper oxidase